MSADRRSAQVKKFVDRIVLVADLAPGILMVAAGVAVIIGARTGVLWL